MKKIILLVVALSVFVSCTQKVSDTKEVEKQIVEYQKQITEINKRILKLQQKLSVLRENEKSNMPAGLKFKVKTETVHKSLFKHYFEASGNVQAVNETFISPEVNGQVEKIFVVEGDRVKKGQLLARLETDMIKTNINELKASLQLATLTYKKQKDLWKKNIGSEMQYLQAKTKKETLENKLKTLQIQYDKSFIKSPIDGYVETVNLKEGELAVPGIKFIHIVNLNKMYINAELSESYLPVVKTGDTVEVYFATFPDIVLHEPIYRIGNVINKQSRSFKVQLKIKNPEHKLKPNLLATLKINDYINTNALIVPSVLIKEDVKGYYMYMVAKKANIYMAKKRYITIGKSSGNKTEVIKGLTIGERFITDGYNNVSDGTLITIQ